PPRSTRSPYTTLFRSRSAHKGPHFFQSKRVATALAGGTVSSSRCMAPRSFHARGVLHDLFLVDVLPREHPRDFTGAHHHHPVGEDRKSTRLNSSHVKS